MKQIFVFITLLFLFPKFLFAKEELPKLVIYTTKSFLNSWENVDSLLKNRFETKCNCRVDIVTLGGSSAILSRLMLEGEKTPADLVIGIDNNLADKAKKLDLFVPHNIQIPKLALPIEWNDEYFIPYDYGYLSFIYNNKKLKNPPTSFEELINTPNLTLIIQDPRSSTLGLGLVAWVRLIYGDKTPEVWHKLKRNVVTITKGFSDSYNLFEKGEADLLLSYSTSPAYNMVVEENYDIRAAEFKEGHYLQIELIGKLKHSKQPELANLFLKFVLSQEFQSAIPISNYMFPIIEIKKLPKEYSKLFIPSKIFMADINQISENRNLWIKEWLQEFSKK